MNVYQACSCLHHTLATPADFLGNTFGSVTPSCQHTHTAESNLQHTHTLICEGYSRHTLILYATSEYSCYLLLRCHCFKATCSRLSVGIFSLKQPKVTCLKDTGISELSGVNSEINAQPLCYLPGYLMIRPSGTTS